VPTLRVMSWNVESLGWAKAVAAGGGAGNAEIVNFIARTIVAGGVSIAGIMEIKSGIGATLAPWLIAKLNNLPGQPPGAWRAAVSLRQDGGTKEQYIVLWREQAGALTLNPAALPAPAYLVGVFDPAVLDALPAPAVDKVALLNALTNQQYVVHGQFGRGRRTQTLRVNAAKWAQIGAGALNLGVALTPAQDSWLRQRLLAFDVFRFTTYEYRSPFVVSFLLGAGAVPLTVVLFHAPGPQDVGTGSATNLIAETGPAAGAGCLVVMGDFNVTATRNVPARVWTRFGEAVPRAWASVYAPFGPVGANPLLGNTQTTLTNAFRRDQTGVPPVALAPVAVRKNDYDKFFFRPDGGITATAQVGAVDLVAATSGNQPGFANALGTSSLKLFRGLRGAAWVNKRIAELNRAAPKAAAEATAATARVTKAQAQVTAAGGPLAAPQAMVARLATAQNELLSAQRWQAEIAEGQTALAELSALVAGAQTWPPGVGTAAAVYRYGVSDHLPISMQLQFP